MADKDEFKFDDDDAFPETDLSGAFSEGEQSVVTGGEPEYPMTIKKAGGSKLKLLLGVLLVVLAAGGGAYYYLVMSKPAPMPTPPPRRPVAAVPKPATVPPPAVPAAPAAGQAQVAVPPPGKPGAAVAVPVPAPAAAPATVAVAPPPKPAVAVPVPAPAPAATKPAAAVTPPPKPEAKPAAVAAAPPEPAVKAAKPKAAPAADGGPWMVEAGTYLNPSDLKSAKNTVRRLGYEPKVSTMNKVVHMTRLRLGSYPEGEAQAALARAREVAPDAFTLRSGDSVTLYAGTYADQLNVREMMGRLANRGINVEEEPIDVKRTISLLRFGGFASQASAGKAADQAREEGLAAEVIKPR